MKRLLAIAVMAAALAIAPVALQAQTYDLSSPVPNSLPVVGPASTVYLSSDNAPMPSLTQVCFYIEDAATATSQSLSLTIGTNPNGNVSFTVPAAYLAAIPTSDVNPYEMATVYYVPTGSTCNGSVNTAYTGQATEYINLPNFSSSTATVLPDTNTALTAPKAVNFVVTGTYFAPATIVEFTGLPAGTVNATTKYLSPTALLVTSPTIPANATAAGLQLVTVGPQGNYSALSQGSITFYSPVPSALTNLTVSPNPAPTGTTVTFTAVSQLNSSSSNTEGGVPTGPITFTPVGAGSPVTGLLTTNPISTSFAVQTGAINYNTGDNFVAAFGDFNGDGLPDAIVTTSNSTQNFLTVYPGSYPLGTYGTQVSTTLPSSCGDVYNIAVGDVNGDGLADVVVVCFDTTTELNDYIVMLSNGDGTFTFAETVDSGMAYVAALGDFYHHGKLDIAVIGLNSADTATQINTYSGNGNGTFGAAVISTITGITNTGSNPSGLGIADMNGDGYPDLVLSDNTQIGVLISNGDGTVGTSNANPNFIYSLPSGDLEFDSLAVGETTNDGMNDIIATVTTSSSSPYYIYDLLNTTAAGTLSFAAPVVSSISGASSAPIAVANFDGDCCNDVLVSSGTTLTVFSGNGTGNFAQSDTGLGTALPSGTTALMGLYATDLDGDGNADILYVSQTTSGGTLESSYNGALVTGTASASTVGNPNLPSGTYTVDVAYNGTLIYSGSTGTISSLTASSVTTSTAVSASITSPTYGQAETLTATIMQSPTSTEPITGTMTFSLTGGATLGIATVSSGIVVLAGVQLPAGSDSITAAYSGDANNTASTGALNLTVTPAVLTVTATNQSIQQGAPIPTLTYTITGFQYSDTQASTTGAPALSTTATSSSPAGMYPITITQGTLTGTANYGFNFVNGVLTVNVAALSISTYLLSAGTVNTAYTTTLAATGGVTPYTWSILSGTLPAGLQLDANTGIISGTPTTVAVTSFTVHVADSESTPMTAQMSFAIGINTPESVLHTFCPGGDGTCPDGQQPIAGLILANDGNYYGTTTGAGANGQGTAFQITPGGILTTIYNFCSQGGGDCTDGAYPSGGLVQGIDGNLYGTTNDGGANDYGTVFKLTTAGVLTTLYSFTNGADGGSPSAQLIQANDGNFYGSTSTGGNNVGACEGACGTIFQITPAGALTTLYDFCSQANCADGFGPQTMTLLQAADGNLYGTTVYGGNENDDCYGYGTCGTIFQLTPKGVLTTIYSFCSLANCTDGGQPEAGLVQGADGYLYGTNSNGGLPGQSGTAFKITTAGALINLYTFCAQSQTGCSDGANPYAPLFPGSDGNFYGTTYGGGANDIEGNIPGTAFELTQGGVFTTLYSFCSQSAFCSDGGEPNAMIQGNDGNFYGTTYSAGDSESQAGVVFKLSPSPTLAPPVQLSLSASSVPLGSPVTISFTVLNAFSTSMQQCAAFIQNGATTLAAGNWTGLQTGTLTDGVYSGSATIMPATAGTYTYALTCGGIESGFSAPLTVSPVYATTTTLTSSNPTPTYGTPISLTATITPALSVGTPSTANVTFFDGATQLGAVASSNFTATLTGVQLAAGVHNLSATFAGDANYQTSTGTDSLTVTPAVLAVTAASLGKIQGAANPILTYAITGFQYTDNQASATTGAPTLTTPATQSSPVGNYPITITQGTLAAANYTFNFVNGVLAVNATALAITTTSLSPVTVNLAYSATLAAAGGVAPYTWSISAGALPTGLALGAANGIISGAPTGIGVETFTVQVTDSESTPMTATVALALGVNAPEAVLASICAGLETCPGVPQSNLIEADDGNYYGTTTEPEGITGTIFKVDPAGTLTTLYTFCPTGNPPCTAGSAPSGIVQGNDGNFYGVTSGGGAYNDGTVYQLTPAGVLTTIYSFAGGADGSSPMYQLVQGADGYLYGTTGGGGANQGGVFKVTTAGALVPLYTFCSKDDCTDGYSPNGPLVQGSDGNFYGTTGYGGSDVATCGAFDDVAPGCGTAFKITPTGALTTLYDFCTLTNCTDGFVPMGQLVQAGDGNFYGTTIYGGSTGMGNGTAFKMTPTGTLTTLHSFCTQTNCADGANPGMGVFLASDGNFYGANDYGGAASNQGGTAFQLTSAGALTTVYTFCTQNNCADGNFPNSLAQGSDGKLYGTSQLGGSNNYGAIFQLSGAPLAAPVQIALSASSVTVNSPVNLTYSVLNAFSTSMQQCYAFLQNGATLSNAGYWTGQQTGTLANGVYSGSTSVTPTAAGTYTYALTCGGIESGFSAPLTVTAAVAPTLTAITPNTAIAGSAATTITLTGTGFSASDTALVNMGAISTTFNAANATLTAVIPAGDLSTPETLEISVDDTSAGAISNALPFTVTTIPTTTTLSSSVSEPTYGTPISLTATITPQNSDGASTASVTFYDGATKLGAVASSGLTATLTGVELSAGAHNLSAIFAGDTLYQTSTGTLSLAVSKALLTATANNLSKVQGAVNPTLTYTITGFVNGDTQATATTGAPVLTTTATQSSPAGAYPITITQGKLQANNYTFSFVNGTLTVTPAQGQFTLTSISPNTANIGAAATTITLTGAGFTATDQAQVNGTSITTTYVNATTLTAKIPKSDLATPGALEISVFQPDGEVSTNALPFTVAVPPVSIVFGGPGTAPSASQPKLTFTLTNPYPVELTATLNLTFDGIGGVDDPAVEFANGSRTYSFNIAANSTATPAIQIQTGTDEGTISVTLDLALTATEQDVTPVGLAPVDITIPAAAPVITSMTLTRSGDTLTVNIMGYSNTRDMASANFTFVGALGVSIDDPDITVPAATLFAGWYSTTPSQAFGSEFLYTQAFTLSDDNSNIGQVIVTLTNSVGVSGSAAAQ